MMKIVNMCLFFLVANISFGYSQKHISDFLADLSIKDFKLGSSLNDIKVNKSVSRNLSVIPVNNSSDYCILKNQNINFYSIESIDEVSLEFNKGILNSILVEILVAPDDPEFKKAHDKLRLKYGEPQINPTKESLYKTYVWNEGDTRLMLKPLKYSFIVRYYTRHQIK